MKTKYYVLQLLGDVEPKLSEPFETAARRDRHARALRHSDLSCEDGLYRLDVPVTADPDRLVPVVWPYAGRELP